MIAALEVLAAIYARLKGDVSVLHAARANLFLPVDLVHPPTGTVIAVDGREHFTSFRLTALELYPADAALGFDRRGAPASCAARWPARPTGCHAGSPRRASASAACRASAPTTTRCYDLAVPAMGHPPLVRIAAVDGDGAAAYARHRAALAPCSPATVAPAKVNGGWVGVGVSERRRALAGEAGSVPLGTAPGSANVMPVCAHVPRPRAGLPRNVMPPMRRGTSTLATQRSCRSLALPQRSGRGRRWRRR